MSDDRRYWDATAFLAWLNEEDGRYLACKDVLGAAEAGDTEIFTSVISLAEVVRIKGHARVDKDKKEAIRSFFRQNFILVYQVNLLIAELAQDLVLDP